MSLLVFDRLDMLVTSEPTAEIDGALAHAVSQLHAARAFGDSRTITRLAAWIDARLDERCQLTNTSRSDM
jgi:hypothetical protein